MLQDRLYCANTDIPGNSATYLGYRSAAINKLTVNKDGTMEIVEQDLTGVPQLKNFNPYALTSGTTYSRSAGMEAIHMDYHKELVSDSVNLQVFTDFLDGTAVVDTEVKADADGKASITVPVDSLKGVHNLYFAFDGAVYSFDSWKFEK